MIEDLQPKSCSYALEAIKVSVNWCLYNKQSWYINLTRINESEFINCCHCLSTIPFLIKSWKKCKLQWPSQGSLFSVFVTFKTKTSVLCPTSLHVCVALLHPAHQNSETLQLPRGQAGSGGVPRLQADALQSLPKSRTGCMGEEAHRAGPVCTHHLSLCWDFDGGGLWRKEEPDC